MKQYLSYAHRELQFNGNLGVFLRSLIFRKIGHVHVKNVLGDGGEEERREMKEVRRKKEGRKGEREEGGNGGRKTKRKEERREQEREQNRIMDSFQEWSQYGLGTRLSMYTTTSLTARVDELVSNLS